MAALLGAAAIAIVILVLEFSGPKHAAALKTRNAASMLRLLAEPVEGFEPVDSARILNFPEDHGAHRQQRTEAWLLSGVLSNADSRLWAAQLTIFRVGLSAEPVTRQSKWAANEVYAGIFAISYAESGGADVADRASRAAAGLAGMDSDPLRVWIEDWRLDYAGATTGTLQINMQASTKSSAMKLELSSRLPPVSNSGAEQTSAPAGSPFVGYLQPGLQARGTIRQDDRESEVEGEFVLEHAWGELPLPGGPVASDRFTLFLEDGREIILTRSHRVDGSGTPRTAGVLIETDGAPTELAEGAVALTPERYWEDKIHRARYPTHWLLDIRGTDIQLRLVPEGVDHGAAAWRPFWMAPVRLEGADSKSAGTGLILLNGYASAGPN